MSRYDLTDFEWRVIDPLLPNKPREVPRVDDRRVLNGIFWVLRSGAPWRDLPERCGPRTTCYNRFVRWRKAGVWDRLMDAITKAHDGKVQMIDTSIVRVHQQGATAKRGARSLPRSFPRRPHNQNPCSCRRARQADQAMLTAGQMSDIASAVDLIADLPEGAMLLADKGYDADALRNVITERKAWANIPPKANRKDPICFSPFSQNSSDGSRHATTSWQKTTLPSSISSLSASGCAVMSLRPRP
ncbi:IS5 family transposase [Mesorhizobium sp.]|uniref:IS5 family transposase n=1 Tax=Mesorhizobium sp. TaxID=1871066 RepID=UPI00257F029C|nr:IS5 family transposase [Mesorhizobium sp.]